MLSIKSSPHVTERYTQLERGRMQNIENSSHIYNINETHCYICALLPLPPLK